MRTSAARRLACGSAPTSARAGYSLLEVLIVVALLGLAVAISGPSLGRMVERQQAQQTLRAGAAALSELRVDAFLSGVDQRAPEVRERLNGVLEPGWSSAVPAELTFRHSGYCHGGDIQIIEPSGRVWIVSVADGNCQIAAVRPVGGA